MDWLTFLASLIASVSWPIAAFAIAFLFRAQIRKLLDRAKRLSVGDNSVDFGEKLNEAEVQASEVIPAAALPAPIAAALPDARMQQLIALSPAAAVMDSWRAVERETLRLAAPFYAGSFTNRDGKPLQSFRQAAKTLFNAGVITASTYSLLMDLQQLRNSAAHDDEVSVADAIRFAHLATEVLRFIDGPDVVPDNPDS